MALASTHLPSNSGYVVAAYLVFFALLVIYLAIMSIRMSRLERELVELNELADRELASEKAVQ